MKSDLPKVLHEICGRPMLSFVLQACRLAGVDRIVVVVGHCKAAVMDRFSDFGTISWVEQAEQKGTGHAVLCCREALRDFRGSVLVIAGDMPLIRRETLVDLLETRRETDDAVTLATTVLDDPTGYGRILRDAEGRLEGIIEHRDCNEEQRNILEVNPSYYCFDSVNLFNVLDSLSPHPGTGEYFITDAVRALRERKLGASALVMAPAEDAMGINSRMDLVRVTQAMEERIQGALIDDGVTIIDPDNTWIEADVTIGRDTVIQPFSFVGAGAVIGEGCRIGPFSLVAAGATVADGAVVGAGGATGGVER